MHPLCFEGTCHASFSGSSGLSRSNLNWFCSYNCGRSQQEQHVVPRSVLPDASSSESNQSITRAQARSFCPQNQQRQISCPVALMTRQICIHLSHLSLKILPFGLLNETCSMFSVPRISTNLLETFNGIHLQTGSAVVCCCRH